MMTMELLNSLFDEECERISEECVAEGYPSHGSNYDLRVENLMQSDFYAPLFSADEE